MVVNLSDPKGSAQLTALCPLTLAVPGPDHRDKSKRWIVFMMGFPFQPSAWPADLWVTGFTSFNHEWSPHNMILDLLNHLGTFSPLHISNSVFDEFLVCGEIYQVNSTRKLRSPASIYHRQIFALNYLEKVKINKWNILWNSKHPF